MPPSSRSHVRRPQVERSAATQQLVLEETINSLVELGYARLTQTEIARRAGVSVGAIVHHYPTRASLLAAAVEHMLSRRQAEFRTAMATSATAEDRLASSVDALWSMYQGPTFAAWVELWVGARTDHELAEVLAGVDREFLASSEELLDQVLPAGPGFDDPDLRRAGLHTTFALLDGLALGQLLEGYQPYRPDTVLDTYKAMTRLALSALTGLQGHDPRTDHDQ